MNLLFNVTINDISVIYVTAHRCAGGLKKKSNADNRQTDRWTDRHGVTSLSPLTSLWGVN